MGILFDLVNSIEQNKCDTKDLFGVVYLIPTQPVVQVADTTSKSETP